MNDGWMLLKLIINLNRGTYGYFKKQLLPVSD